MEEFKKWVPSEKARRILYGLGILIVASLIFHAGVVTGSYRHSPGRNGPGWGFRGPGFNVQLPRGFIPNGHGAVGTIQSVASSSVALQTRDGSTQTVLLTGKTIIRNRSDNASSTALTAGQQVVVLGTPNDDGTISADLIRVMPGNFPIRNGSLKR